MALSSKRTLKQKIGEIIVRNVISILALFMLGLFTGGCITLPVSLRPEVKAVKPRITGIDFQGLQMAFDIQIKNPFPLPLNTPRFKYQFSVQGQELLRNETGLKIEVPSGGIGTATIPVRINYQDLYRVVKDLSGANETAYALNGAFVLNAIGTTLEVPFSHTGKLPVLKTPKFSILDARTSELSFSRAAVEVDAEIMNPNSFGIGVSDLRYEVMIGNISLGDLTVSTKGMVNSGKKGKLTLNGKLSAAGAALSLLKGGKLGNVKLTPSGAIQTPYGPVKLPKIF